MFSSIIDNRAENTLLLGLQRMGENGRELLIATAFFSLDALLLMADTLGDYERIRLLFGDEASPKQRRQLLEKLRQVSDADLLDQREKTPLLSALQKAEELFKAGRVEARCYTARKFHAKAYLTLRPIYPEQMGILGSGNFTRPGLLQNVELNVVLTPEQTAQLKDWYEEMWAEASEDIVTDAVLDEIRRQIELYEPYYLYLKALYTWGIDRQGLPTGETTRLLETLDGHERHAYKQALRIIERQNGVMVCDGVGLGKSFVALALMEHFLRDGKKVLLVAPKNILENSWKGYLQEYLRRYRAPYGSIHETAMTSFGFDPDDPEFDPETRWMLEGLAAQVDVVVIDESHNFRTTAANRYKNLWRIVESMNGGRKKLVMLTATPINTAYQDISAQLALVTHDQGSIGGYSIQQIRKFTGSLDKDEPEDGDLSGQLSLKITETPSEALNRVLEQVLIQRSRKTCKSLSRAAGKPLRFPKRRDPECIEYTIGPQSEEYRKLIDFSDRVFRPGIRFIQELTHAMDKAKAAGVEFDPEPFRKGPAKGLKLAAFLTEQYRLHPTAAHKQYHDEVHLARLVFANTLKQLESSPPAFQGIIQSLGLGLLARLDLVFGEAAREIVEAHEEWVRTPLFPSPEIEKDEADPDAIEAGDTLDASGEETDKWMQQAISSRRLVRKLQDFTADTFDVERWKAGIISDLGFLRRVHEAILKARKQPDAKLDKVCPVILDQVKEGNRVLVFTQSRRTAEYLEKELKQRLADYNVARIDSRIEADLRAAIMFAFCPGYNPARYAQSVPGRVDVLISTDVLSEGVNLQETGAILNYDIHWNPVRLIQRIGRVDRRLDEDDPRRSPEFSIFNVLPPAEIEKIINLVSMVERRTLKISKALGIDVSFFKSTDPAGTLKEFNKQYEGEETGVDIASVHFTEKFDQPDPEIVAILERIPPGAFGVWGGAPYDGLFALFTMEPNERATEGDKLKYEQIIGRPVLALEHTGHGTIHDAGEILNILSKTAQGESSAMPSDEKQLAKRLTGLKNSVRSQFADIALPQGITPKLVCWMELRKGKTQA